ncbi:RidA family protein [Paenarthrobacter sp. NPDC089675]|uniref:RidA family protein n=1 Tax=Paenarthrobacter sp. NPDC089675 TaxID=3364376 RepID=UPI003828C691
MTSNNATIHERLANAGLNIPKSPKPAGTYVPYIKSGSQILVAGQTCLIDGVLQYEGVVGRELSLEDARAAARICALNVLAILSHACSGDFSRLRMLKMTGYVRCSPEFGDQTRVIDGASDLFMLALGGNGRHVRAALGTSALPRRAPVEIETLFELLPESS